MKPSYWDGTWFGGGALLAVVLASAQRVLETMGAALGEQPRAVFKEIR